MNEESLALIHNSLQEAHSILIPIPEIHGMHTIGTALALAHILQLEGKKASILSSYTHFQTLLSMLDTSAITSILQGSVESIISIDITKCPIESIKYDRDESHLRVYLNSPSDKFTPELVSIVPGQYPYDLVLTLDTENWTQLGNYFLNYPHIFIDTASLAIATFDIAHPYSEKTIIENTYTSSAEIIFDYLKTYYPNNWNKHITNGLLLSLLLSRHKTLSQDKMMMYLREFPNDYDLLIQSLASSITDPQRLLIGRILAHLEWKEVEIQGQKRRYAYSKLFPHDLSKTQTTSEDIMYIFSNIFTYLPTDTLGLHIILDNGKSTKQGYVDFPELIMSPFHSHLDGEYREGVLIYSYASDQDIHTAGKELNTKIMSIFESEIFGR